MNVDFSIGAEEQYLELLRNILKYGQVRGDRTGVGTTSVFAPCPIQIDLSKEFPLLTTKKMFTKGMIHELLWFLKGDTNVKYLQDNNVRFWDSWADEDGNLGPVYGQQLRHIRNYYWIVPKVFQKPKSLDPCPLKKPVILVSLEESKTTLLGRTFESKGSGMFTVIQELPSSAVYGHTRFLVQFKDTGYTTEVDYSGVRQCTVKDLYRRTVFGVGYYGDYDDKDPLNLELLTTWREMLRRCYHKSCSSYKSYGSRGVHVSEPWHNYSVFQKEVKKIPGWVLKADNPSDYSLDKDMRLAANRYGVDTCMWASKEEQSWNTTQVTPFSATSPSGESETFISLGEMVKKYKMNVSAIHRCLKGNLKSHHGWTSFSYLLSPIAGAVLRVKVVDQLQELISGLKIDPASRRHVISLWNPHDLHRMNLPPCHGIVTQFYVSGNTLHCSTYQRSADAFLGLPVNLASYSLLVKLVAHVVGLEPGTLTYNLGDCHIYNNHLEQVREQLSRKPFQAPQLLLAASTPSNILEITEAHISLEGYQCHSTIKGEVAV